MKNVSHRILASIALALLANCKPVGATSSVKDVADGDPGAGGGGAQVPGQSATCAPSNTPGGEDPSVTAPPAGTDPTSLLSAAPPSYATTETNPNGTNTAPDCQNQAANGPALTDIKLNPTYVATVAGGPTTNANPDTAVALRLLEDPANPAGPSGAGPSGSGGAPTGTGAPTSTAAGANPSGTGAAGATSGDPCDSTKLPAARMNDLYTATAGKLPACDDDGFTKWLGDKTGVELPKPTASTDPAAPPPPADTRRSYEEGVFKLLSDVNIIKTNSANALADADPWALLTDRDPTVADPKADLPDADTAANLGINSEVDTLAKDWGELSDMNTLLAADDPPPTTDATALSLGDPGSQNAPKDTNGLKSWELGSDKFNIAFSLGFAAQFGRDQSNGYESSDKALQPTGGEKSPKNFVYTEQTLATPTNKNTALSVGGGPMMDVTLFGKKFPGVGKLYLTATAFSSAITDNGTSGSNQTKNGIEIGVQLFGATLAKKNWGDCDSKTGQCKPADGPPTNSMQQKLAWIGRSAKGRYYFTIGPIPMDAQWSVEPYFGYSWNIALKIDGPGLSAQLAAGIFPRMKAGVSLSGGINFVGQRAGLRGDLTLFNIGPTGVVGAAATLAGGSLNFCPFVKSDFQYQFLSGSLSAYAELWYVLSSKYFQLEFYKWDGWKGSIPLIAPPTCLAPTGGTGGTASAPQPPSVVADIQAQQAAVVAANAPKVFKSQYNVDYCIDQDYGTDASHVYVFKCHGGANQAFTFQTTDQANGLKSGTIVAEDGKCLDLNYTVRSGNGGFKLYLGPCNGGANQTFYLHPNGTITDGMKAMCLDFDINRGDGGGYVLYSFPCHNNANQQWTVK